MATGLLGTSDDREAVALVALVMAHGLVSRAPEDALLDAHLIGRAFDLSRAFLAKAKEPIAL